MFIDKSGRREAEVTIDIYNLIIVRDRLALRCKVKCTELFD